MKAAQQRGNYTNNPQATLQQFQQAQMQPQPFPTQQPQQPQQQQTQQLLQNMAQQTFAAPPPQSFSTPPQHQSQASGSATTPVFPPAGASRAGDVQVMIQGWGDAQLLKSTQAVVSKVTMQPPVRQELLGDRLHS